jgi:hypothetical protein
MKRSGARTCVQDFANIVHCDDLLEQRKILVELLVLFLLRLGCGRIARYQCGRQDAKKQFEFHGVTPQASLRKA